MLVKNTLFASVIWFVVYSYCLSFALKNHPKARIIFSIFALIQCMFLVGFHIRYTGYITPKDMEGLHLILYSMAMVSYLPLVLSAFHHIRQKFISHARRYRVYIAYSLALIIGFLIWNALYMHVFAKLI